MRPTLRSAAAGLLLLTLVARVQASSEVLATGSPVQAAAGDAAAGPADAPGVASASAFASPAPPPASPARAGATFVVTTAADTGAGSLRVAIAAANAAPGLDAITFAIPGVGVRTIALKTALPAITSPVVLDATTLPDWSGAPLVELTYGGLAGGGMNGLTITAGNSVVRGFILNGFPTNGTTTGYGLWLDVAGGNVIEGNWIGLDSFGSAARANGSVGITLRGGSGYNRIGGFSAQARNVIAGNASTGIAISSGTPGHNRVAGNYVGLNAAGTAVVPNGGNNVFVSAPDDTIGGLEPGARNVIAGSGTGFPDLFISATAPRTIVQGNYVGLDASGTSDAGSPSNGINVRSADNVIGDATPAGRNVVGGTDRACIYVFGASATRNRIVGNYLGTDATGILDRGDWNGITLDATTANTIGGAIAGERNLVAGHPGPGISVINGASGNRILGNWIGTNSTGSVAVPNGAGIRIENSPANRIGGGPSGEGNVISGNTGYGVELAGALASNTRLSGNSIGRAANGSTPLGNGAGVFVAGSTDTIGGATAAEGNVIAFNAGAGVLDSSGTAVWIARNSIHSNGGLGVDLFPPGLTPNDSTDADAGPNGLQNFPILDSIVVVTGGHKICGHLESKPGTTYTISLYTNAAHDPSHFGEGESLLVASTRTTDATGHAEFAWLVPYLDPPAFVTATATDAAGNTSEFSQAFCTIDLDEDGIPDCWETEGWGLDVNSDGVVDLDLWARGARVDHKDVFVEADAMFGYSPPPGAIDSVVAAFARAPMSEVYNPDGRQGIALHVELGDVGIPVQDLPNIWADQALVKDVWFGTTDERASANRWYILQAKRLVYRYALWARTHGVGDETRWSGRAEDLFRYGCDDFMVTLGGWQQYKRDMPEVHAGTFMHELGHTLGLRHGGGDGVNYKPNYISVMNYTWQEPSPPWMLPGIWHLDYSAVALGSLDESALDETKGFGAVDPLSPVIAVPFNDSTMSVKYAVLMQDEPADWSGDGVAANTSYAGDLDHLGENPLTPSPGRILRGHADWPNLIFDFRNSPAFRTISTGAPALAAHAEADSSYEELSADEDARLMALPPPRPAGRYVMDGLLDPSARLVASNAGAHLWADFWKGQLYVATEAAAAGGSDLCILVAGSRGTLRAAPLGKAGEVGAFRSVLSRRAAGPGAAWTDGLDRDLGNFSVDTSGTVLEGVIDLRLLLERKPTNFFLAMARYDSAGQGALLVQAPAGDGDGNVDGSEFAEWVAPTGVATPPRGTGAAFALSAAQPNPARGETRLRLTLPSATRVEVSVLDLAGRRVATLADGTLGAGEHLLRWEPSESGRPSRAPGIYFVVARAGGQIRSSRIVVLR